MLAGFTITALCVGDWIAFILQLIKVKYKRRNKPTIIPAPGGGEAVLE